MNHTERKPKLYRLVLHPQMAGRENMAVDEALLLGTADPGFRPVIRLYGFSPPTLTIGRFQRTKDTFSWDAVDRSGITVVRRPTGGHAVLHDNELTYAVVLPSTHLTRFTKRRVYEYIGGLIGGALERCGVAGVVNRKQQGDRRNPDCFGSSGEYEIVSRSGRKLVGSAQTQTRFGCLQHGAVPLDGSHRRIKEYLVKGIGENEHPPTSLAEELGTPVTFAAVRDLFSQALSAVVEVTESELTPEEQDRAGCLLTDKYSKDSWNFQC